MFKVQTNSLLSFSIFWTICLSLSLFLVLFYFTMLLVKFGSMSLTHCRSETESHSSSSYISHMNWIGFKLQGYEGSLKASYRIFNEDIPLHAWFLNYLHVHLAQFDVDINCPNENDRTTMPVLNDIKEWIRSPWTQDV